MFPNDVSYICRTSPSSPIYNIIKVKVRDVDLYSALDDKHLVLKALRHGSHSLTCKTTPCLPLAFVRVHQMAPPQTVVTTSSCSLLLIYRPRKDERLSRPGWLTYSGQFTHISGHPSAAGRAQDRESLPVKTNVLPLYHATNQLCLPACTYVFVFFLVTKIHCWSVLRARCVACQCRSVVRLYVVRPLVISQKTKQDRP